MQGTRKWRTVAACAVAVLGIGAAPASADVLYDQLDHEAPFPPGIYSTDNSDDALDSEAADDFTVPAGERWTIDRVEAPGSLRALTEQKVRVRLYDSADAMPGASASRRTSRSAPPTAPSTCR